jgi:hypothetical protein
VASSILGFEVSSGVVLKFRVWDWESALDSEICLKFVVWAHRFGTKVAAGGSADPELRMWPSELGVPIL